MKGSISKMNQIHMFLQTRRKLDTVGNLFLNIVFEYESQSLSELQDI